MAEIYNGTGKTKVSDLSITRATGALLITSSRKINELTNERISIYVEKANGSNLEIAKDILLSQFILASVFGATKIKSDTLNTVGLSAICEIAINGSIPLAANERIKVSLSNLVAAQTYSINSIAYPVVAEHIITFDKKVLLEGEQDRLLKTAGSFLVVMNNFDKISEIEQTFSNGYREDYSNKEIDAIAFDVEDIISADVDGSVSMSKGSNLVLSLEEVDALEISKDATAIELLFAY